MKQVSYQFYIFLFLSALFACRETTEGCLDSSASNFTVNADDDCCAIEEECCCTYPDLLLEVSYKLTSTDIIDSTNTNFKLNTLYALDNEVDSIQLDTFELFISQLKPSLSSSEDTICVIETLEYDQTLTNGDTESFVTEDNIGLINGIQFSFSVGTYQSILEEVDQIDLVIGLTDELAQIDPDDITSDSDLNNSYDYLYNEDLGLFSSIKTKFTIKNADSERIIIAEVYINEALSHSLTTPISLTRGGDLSIPLRINVLDLFKGIIFDTVEEDIELIISENLINSISIIE